MRINHQNFIAVYSICPLQQFPPTLNLWHFFNSKSIKAFMAQMGDAIFLTRSIVKSLGSKYQLFLRCLVLFICLGDWIHVCKSIYFTFFYPLKHTLKISLYNGSRKKDLYSYLIFCCKSDWKIISRFITLYMCSLSEELRWSSASKLAFGITQSLMPGLMDNLH